jgi:hypothetical protein
VGRTDERPLFDLGRAVQEVAEATRLLNLADHRLDRFLGRSPARAPAGALESRRHGRPRAGSDSAANTLLLDETRAPTCHSR